MFVSIIRTPEDGKSQRRTAMYECERFYIDPEEGTATTFLITMQCKSASVVAAYDTSESGLGIYVMNDCGRTVDTIFSSMP